MKTIIAGSRAITDYEVLCRAIEASKFLITEVVSGGAMGVDSLGERWAQANQIPVRVFKPDWSLGKRAGMVRNEEMNQYADALIAVWDGVSRGTCDMIGRARQSNKKVYVHRTGGLFS